MRDRRLRSTVLVGCLVWQCGVTACGASDVSEAGLEDGLEQGSLADVDFVEHLEALSPTQCTGSSIVPDKVFQNNPPHTPWRSPNGSGPTPWHNLGQPGCGSAQVFDLSNTNTLTTSVSIADIAPETFQIYSNGAGQGTTAVWTQNKCVRLQLRVYAWRKYGDGSWSYLGNVIRRGVWDTINMKCGLPRARITTGKWQAPSLPAGFYPYNAVMGPTGVYYGIDPAISTFVENAYYRFAVSVRLGAAPDDFSSFSEHPFRIGYMLD